MCRLINQANNCPSTIIFPSLLLWENYQWSDLFHVYSRLTDLFMVNFMYTCGNFFGGKNDIFGNFLPFKWQFSGGSDVYHPANMFYQLIFKILRLIFVPFGLNLVHLLAPGLQTLVVTHT